ncbi:unnamed protein product, partial [Iphiclides podalirius]
MHPIARVGGEGARATPCVDSNGAQRYYYQQQTQRIGMIPRDTQRDDPNGVVGSVPASCAKGSGFNPH